MEKDYQPLVSVAVVTYNSSKTVLETLDSIADQTYPNLELIVSDDCSTDNTVEMCREWIETHKDRFVRTELLTFEKNTGVSANMNRAECACTGEWVKPIAGDDILVNCCVESYLGFVRENEDVIYVFSKMIFFGGEEWQRKGEEKFYLSHQDIFNWPIKKQYDYLIQKNCLPAPTAFYNRPTIIKLGIKNDERIPYLEDWPKWIVLLRNGVHFHFVDIVTVMYRISEESLSKKEDKFERYKKSLALFYVYYQFQEDFQKKRMPAVQRYLAAKTVITGNLFWRGMNFLSKRLFKKTRQF